MNTPMPMTPADGSPAGQRLPECRGHKHSPTHGRAMCDRCGRYIPSKESPMVQRPSWCQDPTCTPDVNSPGVQIGGPGDSAWCIGRVPEPLVTERHGVEHRNDGHVCFRSPVRGVVMLETNEGDLELLARMALRALVARGRRVFNFRWFTGLDADKRGMR